MIEIAKHIKKLETERRTLHAKPALQRVAFHVVLINLHQHITTNHFFCKGMGLS
ncbi:hypothetical protein B0I21_106355 [Sphingobacterium paludis]|uniref:Uncharacterized protein n=1 Tax=Sphingobacterium paludis TaxID=1476465 RepID=A0A4R7CZ99_9SPHI|nr:hypothetical protein B0I21_106355 [Sphingobacterium paludis]